MHGGASGIGTFAIQLAKALGSRVVATVGSAEKAERVLALGADEAVNYHEEDFSEKVTRRRDPRHHRRQIPRPERPGAAPPAAGWSSSGCRAARKAELDLGMLLAKRASVHGTTLRARPVDDKGAIVRSVVDNVWPLVSAGAVRPVVYAEVPMERAPPRRTGCSIPENTSGRSC